GDANGDGEVTLADAVLIMQSLSNPETYTIDEKYKACADTVNHGDGITPSDALAIQLVGLKLLNENDLPTTSEKIEELIKE
ncbi:MAG: cellulose 1,4-beta-cellobiosidase, partial [Ruminococcus sp.]|nr:cellulose 1,4-beta-cellobiosidase [Ruminococcus sp.]